MVVAVHIPDGGGRLPRRQAGEDVEELAPRQPDHPLGLHAAAGLAPVLDAERQARLPRRCGPAGHTRLRDHVRPFRVRRGRRRGSVHSDSSAAVG
eukprot:9321681-Heterocapsa_arctica.AAC.1